MPIIENKEEAVNAHLATVISKLGVTAEAEKVLDRGKHRPDIMFQLRGLRVVIEAIYEDSTSAKSAVYEEACSRVSSSIAHIAVAALYPEELITVPAKDLIKTLEKSELTFRIISEGNEESDWSKGTPKEVMEAIQRVQANLVEENIVEKTAKCLLVHLETIAKLWTDQPESCDKLSKPLKMDIPEDEEANMAEERRESFAKVSALVLANAFIFQEQLSKSDTRVENLKSLKENEDILASASDHWLWIIENINFAAIFELGKEILDALPDSNDKVSMVRSLIDEAQQICSDQVSLRHDLMGRIYHWLLHDAKYLGTYYTSVSAATLLLKIVMSLDWNVDFGKTREIADFKVGDMASGTGTLLMAATQALTDTFIKSRVKQDESINSQDLSTLHRALLENCIHGYDILPTAVHLTAATLALLAPDIAFRKMNLFAMPIGVDHGTIRLGSLDFLISKQIETQLAFFNLHLETEQKGVGQTTHTNAKIPDLDLCVMNPPFVSSRGTNLLFGSHPDERCKMQAELKYRAKEFNVSVTPGLGAIFVPLADKCLKEGGRVAFVLPIAIASGVEWGTIRRYLSDHFHLEVVITSHEAGRTNFSENTALSELMFVARKLKKGEKAGNTCYVTLYENPKSIHEALNTASRVSEAVNKCIKGASAVILKSAGRILGEVTSLPMPKGEKNWTSAIFLQGKLAEIFLKLENSSKLKLIEGKQEADVPICSLQSLGELGYDVRDVTDAFRVDETATLKTPYAGFWNHDSNRVTQICQTPNSFLIPRENPISGRKLKDPKAVWKKSGNVLIVARVRTNTHRVIATKFDVNVVANTWWEFSDGGLSDQQLKALLLWLNSTLGILMLYGNRAVTEGPWIKLNKKAWENTGVLDVRQLKKNQLKIMEDAFDENSVKELKALSQADSDEIRVKMDASICEALNLPDLYELRGLLAREPGFTG